MHEIVLFKWTCFERQNWLLICPCHLGRLWFGRVSKKEYLNMSEYIRRATLNNHPNIKVVYCSQCASPFKRPQFEDFYHSPNTDHTQDNTEINCELWFVCVRNFIPLLIRKKSTLFANNLYFIMNMWYSRYVNLALKTVFLKSSRKRIMIIYY